MAFFWMIVILFGLLSYVILDGYDLGIGVLTLFQPNVAHRRQMLEVVGNVWDGNETWILLIAMGLWGGFPDAYATALPGLYMPLIVMLFALIFRGFAVEMALHRAASDRTLDPPVRARLARRGVRPGRPVRRPAVRCHRPQPAVRRRDVGLLRARLCGAHRPGDRRLVLPGRRGHAASQDRRGAAGPDGPPRPPADPGHRVGCDPVGRAAPGRDERAAATLRRGPLAPV